jgi:hypothetical protein
MEVALLGGSFNPPHLGHLLAAHVVRALEPVDQVWFVPTAHHPFGKPLIDVAHRLAMCELMCRDAAGWLATSDVEAALGGKGYTVDTLRELHRRWPDRRWTLVVGSDIVAELISGMVAEDPAARSHRRPQPRGPSRPGRAGTAAGEGVEHRGARGAGGGTGGRLVHRAVLAYIGGTGFTGPRSERTRCSSAMPRHAAG